MVVETAAFRARVAYLREDRQVAVPAGSADLKDTGAMHTLRSRSRRGLE